MVFMVMDVCPAEFLVSSMRGVVAYNSGTVHLISAEVLGSLRSPWYKC